MTTLILACLLFAASSLLCWQVRPDDPRYQPRHLTGRNPAADELRRAVSASRRVVRRSPAPWAQPSAPNTSPEGDI